jgi:hypothetical protein
LSPYSYAQKLIDTKKVPEIVTKRFDKKYRSAEEVKWFMIELEHDYEVKFLDGGLECIVRYDKTGKELNSKMEVELGSIHSRIADELRANHRDKEVEKVYLITKGREKYYSIFMTKSQGRKKEPLHYEIQYTSTGGYITIYEPEIKLGVKKEIEPDKYEEVMENEIEDIDVVDYNQDIKKDDLPSPAVNYLKERYDIEYRFKEIKIKSSKKLGEHYYVVLKKQGEKKQYIYYFDIYGEMIKEVVEEL